MEWNLSEATQTDAPYVPHPPPTFWTCCDNCNTTYERLQLYVNEKLHCNNCLEAFTAMEIPEPSGNLQWDQLNNNTVVHPLPIVDPVAPAELAVESQATQTAAQSVPRPPALLTFWTCCDKCKMQYEHNKLYQNIYLRCRNCLESFMAVETPEPSRSFQWDQFEGNAVLDLPKEEKEVETEPSKKRKIVKVKTERRRSVLIKVTLRDFDFTEMIMEKGRAIVRNILEMLDRQENANSKIF